MRKALATVASGPFADLHQIARPGLEAFADQHGWDLIVETETRSGRPASWAKIPLLADLTHDYEVVAWVDADAVIVDDTHDLAAELRPGRDLYLVEHNVPELGQTTANAGVGMIRAGRWADRFLAEVWAQTDLVDHQWWENAAILRLLGYRLDHPARRHHSTPWLSHVRFIDLAWNSMPHWPGCACPNPRILHYGGLPLRERRARMLTAVSR